MHRKENERTINEMSRIEGADFLLVGSESLDTKPANPFEIYRTKDAMTKEGIKIAKRN
jgi:hypothetical protein